MKKSILACILILALCAAMLAGCGAKQEATPAAAAPEAAVEEKEVYRVMCSFRLIDDFSAWLKQAFEAEAAKYDNIELVVVDNKQDADTWISQLENAVTEGYDYFLSMPPDADCTELVKDAQSKGLKLINIEINVAWALGLFAEVNVTDYDMTALVANLAAANLPENANVVILNGIAGIQPTIDRRATYQELLLDARPDITLLDEQTADFQKDQAMSITDDWIQQYGDTINGVLSANDTMALGAMESFISNGYDASKIQFYGIDGLADACQAIIDGTYTASASQDASVYARIALDLVQKDIAGEVDLNLRKADGHENGFEDWYDAELKLVDASNAKDQLEYLASVGMAK